MDKIKNKYEIILGFVTVVISLSAFKDELSQIVLLNIGTFSLTASTVLFYAVLGFSLSVYIYVIENTFRDTFNSYPRLFDFLLKTAYVLFKVILILPPVILIVYGLTLVVVNRSIYNATFLTLLIIATGLTLINSYLDMIRTWRRQKEKQTQELEEKEIKELENAQKLFTDGYFSHSILESFKIIELFLTKKLVENNIVTSRKDTRFLLDLCLEHNIIKKTDYIQIDNLRKMRNVAAHTDINYNKEQAEEILTFIKKLLGGQ